MGDIAKTIGNKKSAEMIIKGYSDSLDGLSFKECVDSFGGKMNARGCVLLQNVLKDGYVNDQEQGELLRKGFSQKFVSHLKNGNALKQRAKFLEEYSIKQWYRTDYLDSYRIKMIEELGYLHSKSSISVLKKAMDDSNWRVRESVVKALGKFHSENKTVIPILINALNDESLNVWDGAAKSLGKFGLAAVRPLIEALKKQPDYVDASYSGVIRALYHIGPDAVPALLRELKSEDSSMRFKACKALGYLKPSGSIGKEAAIALGKALKDNNNNVRGEAAEALSYFGPTSKPALAALEQAVKDKYWLVREYAAQALGNIGPDAAPSALKLSEALKDRRVHREATNALKNMGQRAVLVLARAIKEGSWHARDNAANGLAAIGTASIPTLIENLRDDDPKVRYLAARAIGQIGPAANAVVSAWLVAMKDIDPGLYNKTVKALGQINNAKDKT